MQNLFCQVFFLSLKSFDGMRERDIDPQFLRRYVTHSLHHFMKGFISTLHVVALQAEGFFLDEWASLFD